MTRTKQCRDCRKILPATDFYTNRRAADGLQSYCKICASERACAYHRSDRGRERLRQRQQASHAELGKTASLLKNPARLAWWNETPDVCHYCRTTIEDYRRLREAVRTYAENGGTNSEILKFLQVFKSPKHTSSQHLTIGRRDKEQDYDLGNIIKICWICEALSKSLLTENQLKLISPVVVEDLWEVIDRAKDD